MRLTTNLVALQSALSTIAPLVDRKSLVRTVLLSAHEGVLSLSATNLTCAALSVVRYEATGSADGLRCVDAKKLAGALKGGRGREVRLELDSSGMLEVRSGRTLCVLPTADGRDFPAAAPPPEDACWVQAPLHLLCKIAQPVMSKDQTRAHLACLHLEMGQGAIEVQATDGHRGLIAVHRVDTGQLSGTVNLPPPTVKHLARLRGEAAFTMATAPQTETHRRRNLPPVVTGLWCLVGTTLVSSKVVDASFPPLRQVVPKDNALHVAVNRFALLDALKVLRPLQTGSAPSVWLGVNAGVIRLRGEDGDAEASVRREVLCSYQGPSFSYGCNNDYLADALVRTYRSEVVLEFSSASDLDPFVVRGDDGILSVIMPMGLDTRGDQVPTQQEAAAAAAIEEVPLSQRLPAGARVAQLPPAAARVLPAAQLPAPPPAPPPPEPVMPIPPVLPPAQELPDPAPTEPPSEPTDDSEGDDPADEEQVQENAQEPEADAQAEMPAEEVDEDRPLEEPAEEDTDERPPEMPPEDADEDERPPEVPAELLDNRTDEEPAMTTTTTPRTSAQSQSPRNCEGLMAPQDLARIRLLLKMVSEGDLQCPSCSEPFTRAKKLANHWSHFHAGLMVRPLFCPDCPEESPRKCATPGELVNHWLAFHRQDNERKAA